ncbi:hypothetical protein Pelo_7662 [Pelomyxa schiedti]|nr:hypothetical protein Pelo_7662 [Pelomyxa schiedti]
MSSSPSPRDVSPSVPNSPQQQAREDVFTHFETAEPLGPNERELVCPICLDLLSHPVVHPECRSTFCLGCVARLESCPHCRAKISPGAKGLPEAPNVVRNLVNRVRMRCLDCGAVCLREQCHQHYREVCPIVCPNACSQKITRATSANHVHVACTKAVSRCAAWDVGCSFTSLREALPEHEADCQLLKLRPALKVLVPSGTVFPYAGDTNSFVPPGFLPCDGRHLSRDEYSSLFQALGYRYGRVSIPRSSLATNTTVITNPSSSLPQSSSSSSSPSSSSSSSSSPSSLPTPSVSPPPIMISASAPSSAPSSSSSSSSSSSHHDDFCLPDYRGRFMRGVSGSSCLDPDADARTAMHSGGNTGNSVGSIQRDSVKSHAHILPCAALATLQDAHMGFQVSSNGAKVGLVVGTSEYGAAETRPQNVYVNYIIRI